MSDDFADALDRATKLIMERCDQLQDQINEIGGNAHTKSIAHEFHKNKYTGIIPGLMPIKVLLDDPLVTDILINGTDDIYIERGGRLEKTNIRFESEEKLWETAQEIALRCGRMIDAERPILDARLTDGSRVNIVSSPLALNGTVISIRKFADKVMDLDFLAHNGSASPQMVEFLKICAVVRANILIVGGTGAGKTTLLNAISQYIQPEHRVVTIEDSAELKLPIPHVIKLEAKTRIHGAPENTEVTIRDLVKNALRMRPDRIIVGETRGAEGYDVIQAMNTGHIGSMTTIHANSSRDGLTRMENMIGLAAPNTPLKSVRQQIASALNIVIRISRMRDGERRITNITEITGMEGDTLVAQELFEFIDKGEDQNGRIKGEFRSAGIMPRIALMASKVGFREQMQQIFKHRA
jgi:pilus assembly protein CpaF